jgi:two-component system phosphate regulon sensor histidine kinase PhoR
MHVEKPGVVALIVSLVTGITVLIMLLLIFRYNQFSIKLWVLLLSTILVAVTSYFVTFYSVNQFIYSKVKVIFKTIHEIKAGTDEEEEQIARSTSLEMAEKEVAEWAEERKAEITELKAREMFRREFIGNVSHELKTPIFNIQGYILTLIDGGLVDEKINMKYLKRASKSVERMINLIQDMDTLNKLESGILEIKVIDFDLVKLTYDVLDMLEDSAKKRAIHLKTSLKRSDEYMVHADPNRIEQVLFNLLINAIKYGKRNGHVNISTFNMEDRLLIEVEDDGMGIPEQDIGRIFERFYRVDKSRTRDAGGSGLGLSIVKHIIDAHKETINVRSTEGIGSTFSFTLKKAE